MKMKLRTLGTFVAATGVVGAMFAGPAPATANPNSGHVHVQGNANCDAGYPVAAGRVRIQAANAEAAEGKVDFFGNYSMDFNRVPKEGEKANAYVFCKGGDAFGKPYGHEIRLARPASPFSDTLNLNMTRDSAKASG
jgi:hypothetical protein